jgi:hypothetical protein
VHPVLDCTDWEDVVKKKVDDNVTESWLCVDCGVNTAPGCPDGPTTRAQLALGGKVNCVMTWSSEIFMVRKAVWKAARMRPLGGCLCVGCLEQRLGRQLRPKDFEPEHPFNHVDFPRSRRLRARMFPDIAFREASGLIWVGETQVYEAPEP